MFNLTTNIVGGNLSLNTILATISLVGKFLKHLSKRASQALEARVQ